MITFLSTGRNSKRQELPPMTSKPLRMSGNCLSHAKQTFGTIILSAFCCKKEDIVRIHASSGTSGKPTVVGYTAKDIETWSDLIARSLTMIGLSKGDVIQNSMNYGLFTGGLGFHYGVERMGA